jgi:A/G-specific adenine glycosylase
MQFLARGFFLPCTVMNKILKFRKVVYDYYAKFKRDLPWRRTRNPYYILVSEIMLQQTQVGRVTAKYTSFIRAFPTVETLAKASLRDIMAVWQGLGYNRRALSLQRLAQKIVSSYRGKIPDNRDLLKALPGIGEATAGAVCAFAFNSPIVFIETNIRSVFIHYFFKNKKQVSDRELIPFIKSTLDTKSPREWYYALMDYGVYLKEKNINPSRKSRHYRTQSPFKGSDRQIRGKILKILLKKGHLRQAKLCGLAGVESRKASGILEGLRKEGLVVRDRGLIRIP